MNRMTKSIVGCALLLATALINTAVAQVPSASDSTWYVHVNLAEMRASTAGQFMYQWVEDEIISDVEDELEIEVSDYLDGISVFGTGAEQVPVILIHGYLDQEVQDKFFSRIQEEGADVTRDSRYGRDYYILANDEDDHHGPFGDDFYFAFGDHGQTLLTPDDASLDSFLANGALWNVERPAGLVVLQAASPLMQGGLKANGQKLGHGPWESEFFKNLEQIALVIGENGNAFDITAQAIAVSPETALAMQNIVQGLISLQAMSQDNPEATALLQNLQVSTTANTTTFNLLIEAETLMSILD